MQLILLKQWMRFKVGHIFPKMQDGVANVLIRRGIGKQHDNQNSQSSDVSNGTGQRASNADAGEKAVGNPSKRHSTRRPHHIADSSGT